jgi:predicted DNA-binding protein with PD1-like motif
MTATVPRLEPVIHPGPPVTPRLISVPTRSRSLWAVLPAGRRLIDALEELLANAGVSSAQVELLSGNLAEVAYCYPAIGAAADQPIWYSSPQDAHGPVSLVGGGTTVGFRDGDRFIHAHAAWFDANGNLRGGHLLPETVIGANGVTVLAHTLHDATQYSADDPESRLPVFTPAQSQASNAAVNSAPDGAESSAGTAVIARVCPGENLLAACGELMRVHGLGSARVGGSIGSLVGAALQRPSGVLWIDGPATEVALTGHLHLDDEGQLHGQLSAIVIDRHGRVHMGDLLAENLVAVTVELFLEEAR